MLVPNSLPGNSATTAFALNDINIIHAVGEDAEKFLQGQLTIDVAALGEHEWRFAGHCDNKGKVWSILRIARATEGFWLLQPQATASACLAQLHKFSVFSKVTFTDVSAAWQPYAVTGINAAELLASQYQLNCSQPCTLGSGTVQQQQNQQLWQLAEGVLLLLLPASASAPQAPALNISGPAANQAWLALQIEHNWPVLSTSLQQTYVPQMLNLDILAGISFKKGCYIGQETIARMHYKGMNKRRLFQLSGYSESIPTPTTDLEVQMGENWRRAGAVISAVRYDNDVMAIQAVLPSDISNTAVLRIKGQEHSKFTLCPPSDETESINE